MKLLTRYVFPPPAVLSGILLWAIMPAVLYAQGGVTKEDLAKAQERQNTAQTLQHIGRWATVIGGVAILGMAAKRAEKAKARSDEE